MKKRIICKVIDVDNSTNDTIIKRLNSIGIKKDALMELSFLNKNTFVIKIADNSYAMNMELLELIKYEVIEEVE